VAIKGGTALAYFFPDRAPGSYQKSKALTTTRQIRRRGSFQFFQFFTRIDADRGWKVIDKWHASILVCQPNSHLARQGKNVLKAILPMSKRREVSAPNVFKRADPAFITFLQHSTSAVGRGHPD